MPPESRDKSPSTRPSKGAPRPEVTPRSPLHSPVATTLPSSAPSLPSEARSASTPAPASHDDSHPGSEPADATRLPRGALIGRYIVLEWLGGGGMGVVYAAYDPELDRKIAIKLVRPEATAQGGESEARARLLREAQAIARVRHPAVIAVHDVGPLGFEVFVAMEYIAGRTLRQWLAERARGWRQVLDLYLQAGHGLAAAHEAGLVHRDFKPDNVVVGEDERPRVLDFGLARATVEITPGPEIVPLAAEASFTNILATPVTQSGVYLGTPAYMAPEQFMGRGSDARIDQFSFCVALYEGVYGERPFAGATVPALVKATREGKVRDAPRSSTVPAWLREALLRGLRPGPEARYPSMGALLAELGRDRTRTRRRVLAAAAVMVAVAAMTATVGWARRAQGQVCRGAEAKLTGVWDGERRRAVESAFGAIGKAYATEALSRVEGALDAYTAAWVSMQTDSCAATRVRGEQSEELLDLRALCLGERREEVRALVDVLARADDKTVLKSARAAAGLPDLDQCANAGALKATVRPPTDAGARSKVEAIRARIADARALRGASKYADALKVTQAAAEEARALGYVPLVAEALCALGEAQDDNAEPPAAEQTLKDALYAAEQSHHDAIAAEAWVALVWNVGVGQAHYAEIGDIEQHAMAAIVRWGEGSDEQLVRLLNGEGGILTAQGKFEEARPLHERALAVAERAPGSVGPWRVEESLNNLGIALMRLGKYEEATSCFQRAIAIVEKIAGPASPEVTAPLGNMSTVLALQNKPEESVVYDEKTVQIVEAALGPDHPRMGIELSNLCSTHVQLHADERAIGECERALAIYERVMGPTHPRIAFPLLGMGQAYLNLGKPKSALPLLERALALRESNPGDPMDLAGVRFAVAKALRASHGDDARARSLAEKARAAFAANGELNRVDLDEVEAWLKAR